jgi:hypothetical protein
VWTSLCHAEPLRRFAAGVLKKNAPHVIASSAAASRLVSERNRCSCLNPVWQPLSERSERSGWYPIAHPLHSLCSFSGCHPGAKRSLCFLGAVEPLRGWCRKETDEPFFAEKGMCLSRRESKFRIGHSERSRGIWPTIVGGSPFETRFLRYMMLRITPVGMTIRGLAYSGEKSVCFLAGAQWRKVGTAISTLKIERGAILLGVRSSPLRINSVEESVKNSPAKRLNCDHGLRTWLAILK